MRRWWRPRVETACGPARRASPATFARRFGARARLVIAGFVSHARYGGNRNIRCCHLCRYHPGTDDACTAASRDVANHTRHVASKARLRLCPLRVKSGQFALRRKRRRSVWHCAPDKRCGNARTRHGFDRVHRRQSRKSTKQIRRLASLGASPGHGPIWHRQSRRQCPPPQTLQLMASPPSRRGRN